MASLTGLARLTTPISRSEIRCYQMFCSPRKSAVGLFLGLWDADCLRNGVDTLASSWLRSLRLPKQGVGAANRSSIRGLLKYTSSIGCSGDGLLVAWAGGGTGEDSSGICIWHPKFGSLEFVPLHSAPFDLAVSDDGCAIALARITMA